VENQLTNARRHIRPKPHVLAGAKPRDLSPKTLHPIRQLQARIGNRAVGQVVQAKLRMSPHGDHHEQGAGRSRDASCACGEGGPVCQTKSDLNISRPNDPAEIEADQVADRVMRMTGRTTGSVADAEGGHGAFRANTETNSPLIRTKRSSDAGSTAIDGGLGSRIDSRRGGGSPLDSTSLRFFEPRFGTSLEQVRIHTDGEAAMLNRELSAKAFTIGHDIFFGAGQYQPDSEGGKSLLAHELTHVGQGGNAIRRCKDKSDEAKYDAIIAEIKALDAYKNLDPAPKVTADTIITEGKEKTDCLYYAKKLKVLFTTGVDSSATVATDIRKETATAVKEEEKRLETKEAKKTLDVEEAATADPEPEPAPEAAPGPEAKPAKPKAPGRSWTTYPTRFGGGSYKVDATDPLNIFVKVKVNLVPAGSGTWDDVKKIKSLEDAIEKHASRKGFTLNLEFVNPENRADFVADAETVTINANPRWPNATNWGGNARTCAHELFHVLNFTEDRYNYIESHSTNRKMVIAERLTWFLRQMHKPPGFDKPESLMASGQNPIEEDVCTIARLDMATCLKAREKLASVSLDFRARYSIGYANIAGTSGNFQSLGLDLGIPLDRQREWMLFIGLNGSMLAQLDDENRMAFLAGGRLGIERRWSPSTGGPFLGGFVGGGAAFVRDSGPGGSTSYLPGGYGELGLSGGYKFSTGLSNLTILVETGVGTTTVIRLNDPTTGQADPRALRWFQAGLGLSLAF
jgi:hypothetical protein